MSGRDLEAAYRRIPAEVRELMEGRHRRGEYINGTAWASHFGRRINDFTRSWGRGSTCRLIERRQAEYENCKHVWLHVDLLLPFLSWLSPEFAVWQTGLLDKLLTTGECGGVRICQEHIEAELAEMIGEEAAATVMGFGTES